MTEEDPGWTQADDRDMNPVPVLLKGMDGRQQYTKLHRAGLNIVYHVGKTRRVFEFVHVGQNGVFVYRLQGWKGG